LSLSIVMKITSSTYIECQRKSTKSIVNTVLNSLKVICFKNQSTEGAEFVWVSQCQKGEGCEIIKQFNFVECHQCFPAF
jgi:hypothetical protein